MNSFFSAIFDVFYPVSLAAHLFGLGWIFDGWLIEAVNSSKWLTRSEFLTPLWFFVSYLILSLVAAFDKRLFFVFNMLIVAYFVAAMIFLRYQGVSA
jgi:competence protein ComEC